MAQMLLNACQYPVLLVPPGSTRPVPYYVVTEHDVLLPPTPEGEYPYPMAVVVDALRESELRKGLTEPGARYHVPVFRLRNARQGRVWSGGAEVGERAYIGDGLIRVEDM